MASFSLIAVPVVLGLLAPLAALAQGQPPGVVSAVSRRVDEKSQDEPWLSAPVGHELREGDGLRTARGASAAVTLSAGGGVVVVGESSTVFLRAARRRQGQGAETAVEIGSGQVEVRSPAAVDVVAGSTRVRSGDLPVHVRTRRAGGSLTRVMAYAGSVEVETPGGRVTLPAGTGATVRRFDAPGRAEVLLADPATAEPDADALLDHSNPTFRWRAVEGAVSYLLEVCRDAACGSVVERKALENETRWTIHRLTLGKYFWRVTASSASGLDGYPSETRGFEVRALWRRPPTPIR